MKTPITEVIEQIKKMYENENITGFSKRAYAQCLDILESKLPKEKEVIEKACIDIANIALDNLGNKNVSMKKELETYFNETFTQK
jgi:ATP-dependent protease HslVU (ClpYQ) peptidase subunit